MVVGAKAMTQRSFPPLWSAELQPNYYVVRDANSRNLRTSIMRMSQGGDQRPINRSDHLTKLLIAGLALRLPIGLERGRT